MEKLDRESLFAIVADAAFQDGQLEDWEKQILQKLTGFLRLDPGLAQALVRRSRQRYQEGALGPAARLDGEAVYLRCLQVALADGMLEEDEEQLLKAMRGLFKVSPQRHDDLLGRARAQRVEIPPPAPPGGSALPAGAAATQAALDQQAASILSNLEANPEGYTPSEEELRGKRAENQPRQRFRLKVGGLPIPFLSHMLVAGVAGAVLLGGMLLQAAIFEGHGRPEDHQTSTLSRSHRELRRGSRRSRDRRHSPEALAFAALSFVTLLVYLGLRGVVEQKLLGDGASIAVGDGVLELPGFLRSGSGESFLVGKAQVDRIDLGVSEEGTIHSVSIALEGEGRLLRFGRTSVEDVTGLVAALGERLGVPAEKCVRPLWLEYSEVLLAGGSTLFGGAVLYLVCRAVLF